MGFPQEDADISVSNTNNYFPCSQQGSLIHFVPFSIDHLGWLSKGSMGQTDCPLPAAEPPRKSLVTSRIDRSPPRYQLTSLNSSPLSAMIRTPAIRFPTRMAGKACLKRISSSAAARLPLQTPVPGRGIATNRISPQTPYR